VLEGDFEVAAFAWSKRRRLRREHGAGFAQNDLAKLVGEFDSELDVGDWKIAGICQAAGQRGDFLIQKILGAAESQVFNLKVRGVSLFGGTEGKMRFASGSRTGLCARPHYDGKSDGDRGGAHPSDPRAAGFWRRLIGRFDLQGVRHGDR